MGGWEHQCCGEAIERNQLVDLGCSPTTGLDGRERLSVIGHHLEPERQVHGRVRDLQVLRPGQSAQPILRMPSGRALRGVDPDDDGHLEDPWTGELVSDGEDFLVTVHASR